MVTNDTNAVDMFLRSGREDSPFFKAPGLDTGRIADTPAAWMPGTVQAPWLVLTALAALPFAMFALPAMLPFALTWKLSENYKQAEDAAGKPAAGADSPAGIKVGDFEIPQRLLSKLLKMEMSPDNLSKLQRLLDVTFSLLSVPGGQA